MVHCWHFRLQMSTFACLTLLFTKLASHCLENQHENYECIGIFSKCNCKPKIFSKVSNDDNRISVSNFWQLRLCGGGLAGTPR